MRRARAIIQTPIGNIFTVDDGGVLYFNIKEVCAGIGLRGHSPWSWHAESGDNRERYYRRYSMKRRQFTANANGRGSITLITLDGLHDYLSNPRLKNGMTVMFRAWLDTSHPIEAQGDTPEPAQPCAADDAPPEEVQVKNQISMDQCDHLRAYLPSQPKRWRVQYVCPECGFQAVVISKHCPECGERLVV